LVGYVFRQTHDCPRGPGKNDRRATPALVCRSGRHDQSRLMPASLITASHLATSALIKAPSASGVDGATIVPIASSFDFTDGSVSAATVSALSFFTRSGGVFAGAIRANQPRTSNPGRPVSAAGGISGAIARRSAVDVAITRTRPERA